MNNIIIGLTFISVGSISFIIRYIIGAMITSIIPTYSKDGYYSNVSESGGQLLIFSIVYWIIGAVFIAHGRRKIKKTKEGHNAD